MNECLSRDIRSESLESEGQVSLDFFWIPEGRGSEGKNLGHLHMGLLVCDSGWSLAAQESGSASTGDAVRDPQARLSHSISFISDLWTMPRKEE